MPVYFIPGTRTEGAEGQFDLALVRQVDSILFTHTRQGLGGSAHVSDVEYEDSGEEVEVFYHLIKMNCRSVQEAASRLHDGLISLIAQEDAYASFVANEIETLGSAAPAILREWSKAESLARIKRANEILEAIKAS